VNRTIHSIIIALCLSSVSCHTIGFYAQAIRGQAEILAKRKPVHKVASTTRDPILKKHLALTRRLLAFAKSDLGMSVDGSFSHYTDLGRDHVVWLVHAAPPLSLEPKRWWYPIVGYQNYRGFFSAKSAKQETRRLEAAGYETWIGKVDAYSTLGYFHDPLLNTYIKRNEMDLAELIFHELAHQTYYRRGNTTFNEAMAEAVARESVRRWFLHTNRPALAKKYALRLMRRTQARAAITSCTAKLKNIYATQEPDTTKLRQKAQTISKLKSHLRKLRGNWGHGLKPWLTKDINNPRLNAFTTYEQDIPRFTRLLDKCNGNFPEFWKRIKTLPPNHPNDV